MRQYDIQATKRYKKDFKRLQKSGVDIRKLEYVIELLAAESAWQKNTVIMHCSEN